MNNERGAPRRLVEANGPSGDLLRRALEEAGPGRALPRFVDLRERRAQRLRFYRMAGALTTAGLVLLTLLTLRAATGAGETPAIGAEQLVTRSGSQQAQAAVSEPGATSAPLTSVVASAAVLAPEKPKQRAASAARLPSSRPPSSTTVGAPPAGLESVLGTAKTCAQIARRGAAEEAITCYEKLAVGSGVSAELALFEQARLAGKVLHQPERALRTLANYRERFPRGSLRAEVMLAQIDWLVTSGQSARALALVDEALGSGLLQERASELERVRDGLQREAGTLPR